MQNENGIRHTLHISDTQSIQGEIEHWKIQKRQKTEYLVFQCTVQSEHG